MPRCRGWLIVIVKHIGILCQEINAEHPYSEKISNSQGHILCIYQNPVYDDWYNTG